MNSIFLSICIPTYNRCEALKSTLEHLVQIERNDVEIIVSDNASDDKTEVYVGDFNDSRVKYFKNETNLGANWNVIKSFSRARGEYVFICSDEDLVVHSALDKIIEYLKNTSNIFLLF